MITTPTRSTSPAVRVGSGNGPDLLYNPFLPEFREDPHPFLRRLRNEDPVHRAPIGVWIITRYADVMSAMRDERFSAAAGNWQNFRKFFVRDQIGAKNAMADVYGKWMLQLDPPDHTRLRALLNYAFTPRVVEAMRPKIERIALELLERVRAAGEMDFISDFAHQLPMIVIAEMLGVPRQDLDIVRRCSLELLPSFTGAMSVPVAEKVVQSLGEFQAYFKQLAAHRRANPGDDLMSAMIAAHDHEDKLTEDELVATCILLAFAGQASAVQLTANALLCLLRHPEQLKKLNARPELIGPAIEETMRFESPLQIVYRSTTEAVEIGGKTIPAHEMVFLSISSANRDPAQFADPDTFDIERPNNRHIAFGYGIHYCAGAGLGRLEAQVAVSTALKLLANIQVHTDRARREPSLLLRGFQSLPVTFTPW